MARYIADPNNDKKMIPSALNHLDRAGRAEVPPDTIINHRPNYILINQSGSYAFCYETSSSLGAVNGTLNTYVTSSVHHSNNGLPLKLDINPVCWRITSGVAVKGNVTFVYTGNVG